VRLLSSKHLTRTPTTDLDADPDLDAAPDLDADLDADLAASPTPRVDAARNGRL
jgi:hypothetical protein